MNEARMLPGKRGLTVFALAALLSPLPGCRSRFVEVTIENRGPEALRLIEVDYPSASFGVGSLAASGQFHYRFKIQGSGPLKLEYTDAGNKVHTTEGPEMSQGQEGRLTIAIGPGGKVDWQPALRNPQ